MLALERLGFKVTPFDISAAQSRGVLGKIEYRLKAGPGIARMNHRLSALVENAGCFDVIWVDKGRMVWSEVVDLLRRAARRYFIHYTPDAQFMLYESRHFNASLHQYDAVITTKGYEIEEYRRRGAQRVVYATQSFLRERFDDLPSSARSGIALISRGEAHYQNTALELAAAQLPIRWHRATKSRLSIGNHGSLEITEGVWGKDYPQALAKAQIGLGVLTKLVPDTHTTRSFEIPAAGAMLLAERTDEHREFFREGQEADFFSSSAEMVDKASFYLRNPETAQRIADAGRARCHRDGRDDFSTLMRTWQALLNRSS